MRDMAQLYKKTPAPIMARAKQNRTSSFVIHSSSNVTFPDASFSLILLRRPSLRRRAPSLRRSLLVVLWRRPLAALLGHDVLSVSEILTEAADRARELFVRSMSARCFSLKSAAPCRRRATNARKALLDSTYVFVFLPERNHGDPAECEPFPGADAVRAPVAAVVALRGHVLVALEA